MRSTGLDRMFGFAGSSRRREEVGEYVRGSLWVLPGIAALAALVAVRASSGVPWKTSLYSNPSRGTGTNESTEPAEHPDYPLVVASVWSLAILSRYLLFLLTDLLGAGIIPCHGPRSDP